jgi:Histidine kinase-, DNA gyrase B-, and HSP90-like ATPase
VPTFWLVTTGFLALYLLLDWASYVEPLPHTSITPWNAQYRDAHGIAASVQGLLFEAFVTSKVSGMGLGLSLCRSLLRQQGGDLWSEPSHLGGARFVVRVPTQPTTRVSL